MTDKFLLGVDLGTSHTVAMLRHPDGRTRPLLFDGQPLLPSAVYLDTTGRLHVGADALRLGHAEPGRIEPNPKRHVDDGSVLLGGTSVPVADLFAALLGAVAREAVATAGLLPPAVLTYPAAWGGPRRSVLVEALGKAGWPAGTGLVPEPVAAARYFADVLRRPVPGGASIAVFDFGGGTLDVAVVSNEGHGPDGRGRFAVSASGGADDLGGLDLDAALVDHLGKSLAGAEPDAWHRLTEPVTLAEWRARRQFWDDVRGAKEMLSRSSFAPVPVPGVEHAVHLTRDELEAAADPLLRRGVAEAAAVIKAAGLTPTDLAGLFLVGGSSRVPMVARLLHAELGIAPTALEQPELPVAEGAIIAAGAAVPARFAPGLATAATLTPTPPTVHEAPPPLTDTQADPAAAPTSAGKPDAAPASGGARAEQIPSASGGAGTQAARASGGAGAGQAGQTGQTASAAGGAGVQAARASSGAGPGQAAGVAGDPRAGLAAATAAGPRWAPSGSGGPASGGAASGGAGVPPPREPDHVTDERLKAEPVDPWATGEAAALAAGGHAVVAPSSGPPMGSGSAPFAGTSGLPYGVTSGVPFGGEQSGASRSGGWPAPGSHQGRPGHQGPPPASGSPAHHGQPGGWAPGATTPEAARKRRGLGRRSYLLIALALTVVLTAGVVLAVVFWPGYRAIDFHPLSDPQRVAAIVPVGSDWSDAEIFGDRVYFASSDTESGGTAGVVAIGVDASKPDWTSTKAGQAARWKSMVALPVGVALFSDTDSTTSHRRMAVLGASNGDLLWQREMGSDDVVIFAGSHAVLADRHQHQLLGLALADGKVDWTLADPASTVPADTNVVAVTTPKDLGGPATVFGRPYEPNLTDDRRLVQIGADKSARVIDADTGAIRTSRQNVADPDDEVVAHNGRLIVLQPDDQRIVSYQLDKFGEPRVLYTTQAQNSQMKDVTPCGDDRVCFDEEIGYDGKSATVVSLDVADGKQLWRYPLANTETLVPVGEAVLATTTVPEMTLLDPAGKKVWTHAGEAARLDAANILEFSKPLSRSPGETAISGRHLGEAAVPLGAFDDIRSDTCGWNRAVLACVGEKDFVIQRFAG